MGTYRVRPAVASDLEAILRLQGARVEEAGATVPPPTAGSPEAATWAEMMATPNLHVYVAEQGGEIVGNTCVTVVPNLINGCRPTAFIEPMLVVVLGAIVGTIVGTDVAVAAVSGETRLLSPATPDTPEGPDATWDWRP